jgi:hypothetical protein
MWSHSETPVKNKGKNFSRSQNIKFLLKKIYTVNFIVVAPPPHENPGSSAGLVCSNLGIVSVLSVKSKHRFPEPFLAPFFAVLLY